jgi:signal transduction histidine kinase
MTNSQLETGLESSILIQKEWENILTLLLKDNSIDILADEILRRKVNLTGSDLGIVFFMDDKIREQIDHRKYDEDGSLKDPCNIINELRSNLSFISEWLKINKKPLVIHKNDTNNIGHILTDILNKPEIVVTASFVENTLLCLTIVARSNGSYCASDIDHIGQFASLLAFSIHNALTRSLNNALENKLLQSQKLETIGKLASGMAHDFNNLLSSIFGSLNLLKKKLKDKPEINYLLDNIENCSIRAADLTKGLLSYGKPTPKRKTLIKPQDLLKELLSVVQRTFPSTINIDFNFPSDLLDIMGNSTEIYQVLLNLAINAKEAIKADGKITIRAENFTIDDKNIFDFPLLKKGDYVCFSIIDSGEGISEENLTKIFDPYFSTKQKETGSGLGLYVTYGIIKAHNGYIDVKSKINQGTRFDVYIPSFKKPSARKALVKTEKIILLADDEIMLRDILAELLESYNFDVITVQDGTEVLRVLTEEIKVDLLIIDYKMPEMDGLTCIKKIRELQLDIPVILSTGSTSASQDKEFEKLKIDMILNKPYEFDKMLGAVQKLI